MYVVATAGHVDHGKSTLVRTLTGMEPDRWAEERRRGMTIDLGFVWCDLPSGRTVAFVDVPGHARFVGNMLAGVGPVPAVLFVVAADEGWQQQSAEHLAALDALGVRAGILVITRSDAMEPELALAEAREHLAGTTLEGIPDVAVSAVTGEGMEALRDAVDELLAGLPAPRPAADVRLWVDRVFTIRGSGTVVTGTLGAGTIRVGDTLQIAHTGSAVRVRGLQSLQQAREQVEPVARVAVNLRGVEADELHRGNALLTPNRWPMPDQIDVRLRGSAPAQLPAGLVLHVGSAAVPVRVRPLGPDTARLQLETPLPLRPGDVALLRNPGASSIPAGVTVLDVLPPALRRRGAARVRAAELDDVTGAADPAGEVRRRVLVRRADLVAAGVLAPGDAAPAGAVEHAGWLIDAGHWSALAVRLQELVRRHADENPLDAGLSAAAAARSLGLPEAALVDPLATATDGVEADRGRLRPAGAAVQFPPGLDVLVSRLQTEPFAAPEAAELERLQLGPAVLAAAVRDGRLLRIAEGVFLLPEAEDAAVARLAELDQPFTLSEARQVLSTSRRVAVPLLERLDAQGRTVRADALHRKVRA
ncbi:MAG: selenocysteine-specific translation elongation factor [Actinomycetota bacterium]|nr:selenocysteine-specific translation elongation factor [Actinomycetota bacterium]